MNTYLCDLHNPRGWSASALDALTRIDDALPRAVDYDGIQTHNFLRELRPYDAALRGGKLRNGVYHDRALQGTCVRFKLIAFTPEEAEERICNLLWAFNTGFTVSVRTYIEPQNAYTALAK
jgi:hypothetical protein